jgi:hypothetical protein
MYVKRLQQRKENMTSRISKPDWEILQCITTSIMSLSPRLFAWI